MTMEVREAVTIPKEVFIYKVDDRGESFDDYYSVATLDDLDNVPVGRVNSSKDKVYRRSSAVVEFSSSNKAVRGKEEIEFALRDLVDTYTRSLAVVELDDIIEVG